VFCVINGEEVSSVCYTDNRGVMARILAREGSLDYISVSQTFSSGDHFH